MWIVRVKDRGRDLSVHKAEQHDEAQELSRVYTLLGYDPAKVTVEYVSEESREAA